MENVIIEKIDDIAKIIVNRPKVLNALNRKTLEELRTALEEIKQDDSIQVIVLTGAGERAFVAGADITEFQTMNPLSASSFMAFGQSVFSEIEHFSKPIICAINGFALGGGCELALSCDIRIASENAKIGLPEINLGIFPGWGGTQRLPRLIGKGKAKELIFTGDMITADEANRIGLVNKVVPVEKLEEEVMGLAKKIALKSGPALQLAKAAINQGTEGDLETGLALERNALGICFSTEDHNEGINAFIEKRKAKFQNR